MIRTTIARKSTSVGFLALLLFGLTSLLLATTVRGFSKNDVLFVGKSANKRSVPGLAKFPRHDQPTIQNRQSRFSSACIGDRAVSSSLPPSSRLYSSASPSIGVRGVIDWVQGKPLDTIVSKEEAVAICRELTGDEALLDSLERAIVENWDKIVNRLIQSKSDGSKRTLRGLLGEEATERLLRGVQNIDLYSDPKTVNAFLQSDAVNDLFAQTLCKYLIED